MLKNFFNHKPIVKNVKHIRRYVNLNGWTYRDIIKAIIMTTIGLMIIIAIFYNIIKFFVGG